MHLNVSQDDSQITIDQSTTANIPAIEEQWPYDWQMREHKDAVMGKVAAKSHWVQLSDVQGEDASWLTGEGWLDGGNGDDGKQVEAFVDGIDGGWTAHQVSVKPKASIPASSINRSKLTHARSGDSSLTTDSGTLSVASLYEQRMESSQARVKLIYEFNK